MFEFSRNHYQAAIVISIIKEFEIRVQEHPDKLLYSFLDIKGNVKESYTYKEFFCRVKSIASHLYAIGALKPGDKALLVYPPGLEMICAFFACVKLGAIPVPVYPPSAKGFHASAEIMSFIARNCDA
ncbi:MAG: AMP-binding protein, partial [Candidatus Latescibacteria bacterium]|nr:AMP-binding protein [Candidatus Latescibacterota bacterium]